MATEIKEIVEKTNWNLGNSGRWQLKLRQQWEIATEIKETVADCNWN